MNSLAAIALGGSSGALMRFWNVNGILMPILTHLFGLLTGLAHRRICRSEPCKQLF